MRSYNFARRKGTGVRRVSSEKYHRGRSNNTSGLSWLTLEKTDPEERGFSALHKLREFQNLGYPVRTLRDACARVYRETGRLVWAAVAMMQK